MMRIYTTFLVLGSLFLGEAWAQDVQTVPLGQRTYDVFDLSPSAPVHTYAFSIGQATQLLIDVTGKGSAVIVNVTDPLGVELDPAVFDRFTVTLAEQPPLCAALSEEGEHVQMIVNAPPAGTWVLRLALSTGAPPTLGSITTVASGGIGVSATTSRPFYQSDESVVLAMLAYNGATPVLGANVAALIYQGGTENPLATVALHDEGFEPDAVADDGIYTVSITGLTPGHFMAKVTLLAGDESATSGANFEIFLPLGRFDDFHTDAGIDTNFDGLFDFIGVDFGVNVNSPGTYDVFAELGMPVGDGSVRAGSRTVLTDGTHTVSLRFAASDIRNDLSTDGPWHLRNVRLVKVSTDDRSPDVLADRVDDFGLTNSYSLTQLQRPLTLILPGIAEEAIDTNDNQLYDLLLVSFQVDTLFSGNYTWTGELSTLDGNSLGVASNQGYIDIGATSVSFSFDGRCIGATGIDGPYIVGNVAVYGPIGAAAVEAQLGNTRVYIASDFEGGQITFARLIGEVKALIITGRGGIPRAQGIRTGLLQKIKNSQAQAERGNTKTASNILAAFINEVQAQTDIHIDPDDAERLIDLATQLRKEL